MEFLWFLLIGLCAGFIAGQVMKDGGYGVVGDIIIGVIGAILGGWLFGFLGVSTGAGLFGQLLVATVGAIAFIAILRTIKKA